MYPEFRPPEIVEHEPTVTDLPNAHRSVLGDKEAAMTTGRLIERLVEVRLASGLSQTALAEKMDSSQSKVSQTERGVHVPLLDTFVAHVAALGGRVVLEFPEANDPTTD